MLQNCSELSAACGCQSDSGSVRAPVPRANLSMTIIVSRAKPKRSIYGGSRMSFIGSLECAVNLSRKCLIGARRASFALHLVHSSLASSKSFGEPLNPSSWNTAGHFNRSKARLRCRSPRLAGAYAPATNRTMRERMALRIKLAASPAPAAFSLSFTTPVFCRCKSSIRCNSSMPSTYALSDISQASLA